MESRLRDSQGKRKLKEFLSLCKTDSLAEHRRVKIFYREITNIYLNISSTVIQMAELRAMTFFIKC